MCCYLLPDVLINSYFGLYFEVFFVFGVDCHNRDAPNRPKFDRSEVFIAKLSICMSVNKKSLKTKISSEC